MLAPDATRERIASCLFMSSGVGVFMADSLARRDKESVNMECQTSEHLVPYEEAVHAMEARVAAIRDEGAEELLWLVEHPPVYTGGTSAKADDLLNPQFPVFETGRGGQYTYHGPGQRVAYVMLDLKQRFGGVPDLRAYVKLLENWVIRTLAAYGIEGFIREGRVGVWVTTEHGEAKIAAIGVRVRKGVSYHGISLNVHPDLSHYAGIVPCGISEFGVTSLKALGIDATMEEVDAVLVREFEAALDQFLKPLATT